MPNRSRSHQVEDLSIRLFEGSLPNAWVCRRKSSDYGVDLEIEIFSDDGDATGLVFYIQMKGTDNPKGAKKVSVDIDRLKYLASFDVPSFVVRCCVATSELYFIETNAALAQAKEGAASVTVSFNDLWNNATALLLAGRLKRLRRLKRASPREDIYLKLSSDPEPGIQLSISNLLDDICHSLPSLKRRAQVPDDKLALNIDFRQGQLVVSLDEDARLQVDVDLSSEQALLSALSYGLLAGCWKMGITDLATEIARYCLGNEIKTPFREFALYGVLSLTLDIEDAVQLAIINGLHEHQDKYYVLAVTALLEKGRRGFADVMAIKTFFLTAVEAQEGGYNIAPIYYSLGNLLAAFGDHRNAIIHFNQAKRLQPNFLDQLYFINEFAGALFHCRRFRLSHKLYQIAFDRNPSPHAKFVLADAGLFAEKHVAAAALFDELAADPDAVSAAEAKLKAEVARWFAGQLHPPLMSNVESLIAASKAAGAENKLADAFIPILAASFLTEQEELWSNCIWLSTAQETSDLVWCVILCATRCCRGRAYGEFRKKFGEHFSIEQLTWLDGKSIEAGRILEGWNEKGMTIRLHEENRIQVFHKV